MNGRHVRAAVAVVIGAVVFLSAGVALVSADESELAYREAMWSMVPTVGRWSGELSDAVATARIKPGQVCQVTLPALAYRGQGMVEDLRGTAAPEGLAELHAQLIGTMEEMTAIAQIACEYPDGAHGAMAFEQARLATQRQALMTWLLSGAEPIEQPALPVAHN
jgi:hypothetical protein